MGFGLANRNNLGTIIPKCEPSVAKITLKHSDRFSFMRNYQLSAKFPDPTICDLWNVRFSVDNERADAGINCMLKFLRLDFVG